LGFSRLLDGTNGAAAGSVPKRRAELGGLVSEGATSGGHRGEVPGEAGVVDVVDSVELSGRLNSVAPAPGVGVEFGSTCPRRETVCKYWSCWAARVVAAA